MVAKSFDEGDLVWAKMKSYPEWPGKIVPPPGNKERKGQHYVFFFGTLNYSWIKDEMIKHHSTEQLKNLSKRKLFGYEEAVEQIKKEFASKPKVPAKTQDTADDKVDVTPKAVKTPKIKKETKEPTPKKSPVVEKSSKKRKLSTETTNKSSKKRNISTEDHKEVQITEEKSDHEYATLFKTVLNSMGQEKEITEEIKMKVEKMQEELEAEEFETVIDAKIDELKKPDSNLEIGFLGLGMMGRGLASNLLKAGHNLTVWNRTLDKCDPFVQFGAEKAHTVAEVVGKCDIIFCCVSDPDAVKMIVLGENGVLQGAEGHQGRVKGYVEMTSIDAETSQEIGDAITNAGMRYLEAPIIGSKEKAKQGAVLILGAGDRVLFNDCESCFHAMSNHAYYISCDIGKSANINTITSTYVGVMYTALAEMLALANAAHLAPADLLEIFDLHGIISDDLHKKGLEIINKNFKPSNFLKHQQKDLRLGLRLSDKVNQPVPITATANQMFVRARGLGLPSYDSTGVYLCYKY